MWKKAMGLALVGVLGMVAVCGWMCSSAPPPSVPAQVVVLPFEVPATPVASTDAGTPAAPAEGGGVASAAVGGASTGEQGAGIAAANAGVASAAVTLRPGVLSAEQEAHHARVAERVGEANAACATTARVACSGDLCVVGGAPDARWGRWMRRPSLILEDLVVGPLGLPSGEGTCAHASYGVLRTATVEGAHQGQPCMTVRLSKPDWMGMSPDERARIGAEAQAVCAAAHGD